QFNQPDISNEVVHLTGRLGQPNLYAPQQIRNASPEDRLVAILNWGRIRAFNPFGGLGYPAVALTEGTIPGLAGLIGGHARYAAWGLGFTKDLIFAKGGGPAFYVRGGQWEAFAQIDSRMLR